ncbi:hypothetical protein PU629_07850 [Pullulanibacillus sp. KACC 23026]|uniref:hypothetical protein n=1 Tax=Pullulanibacillus sp. KACC 23026 TaxID=3028315 RepID=UPI0023AFD401|nr:hypothetical protein [Pullulanibacillus sp. KACC 23026]WEG14263.1 hypothetical protein PU629_07850 [Pullulanibacillus sp. KACC 23026]
MLIPLDSFTNHRIAQIIAHFQANSVVSLRSTKIGVTSVLYFGIPAHFATDSVFSLRSSELGVTSVP